MEDSSTGSSSHFRRRRCSSEDSLVDESTKDEHIPVVNQEPAQDIVDETPRFTGEELERDQFPRE